MSIQPALAQLPGHTLRPASSPTTPDWDYSALARSYDARPGYAEALVDEVLDRIGLQPTQPVLDVGAGTGALTALLCARSQRVHACEPNAQMRAIGSRKHSCRAALWMAGRGEQLPVADASVSLVSFGSSFNVLPPAAALAESARVLADGGHWLALWNHRDLDDPLQQAVERCIRHFVPDFDPGRRRQDPRPDVADSGRFRSADMAEQRLLREVDSAQWLRAWRAHATLKQQAGERFERVLRQIADLLEGAPTVCVPYVTRIYWAQRR
jgi:ubiquinone/menaquinone biosynthesis C-methylase UbiE